MTKSEEINSSICTLVQWILEPFGVKPVKLEVPVFPTVRIGDLTIKGDQGKVSTIKYTEVRKAPIQRKTDRQTAKR